MSTDTIIIFVVFVRDVLKRLSKRKIIFTLEGIRMRTEQHLEGYESGLKTAVFYLERGATLEQLRELSEWDDPYYNLPEWAQKITDEWLKNRK